MRALPATTQGMHFDEGERVDGDKERFTQLYDEYRARVWAYATSRAGSQIADEVVSETFTVAWRRFADLPAAPLPWLLGVARNVMRDSFRAQVRRDSLAAELRTWTETVDADVADEIVGRVSVLRALADLPEADREVLTLVAWYGLSQKEAARVVGCNTATLRVRLHRARRRLAAAMNQPSPSQVHRPIESVRMEWL
jgi:RNA polymerase sigma-70 factor (ECF subfamily)